MIDFNLDTNTIRIYGEIGEWDDAISAVDFMEVLDQFDGEDLTLIIKSPGGEIDDGLSIYNQIQSYKGKVRIEIDTQAASIATVIAMAGDEVVMRKRSEMFIHDPWMIALGNAGDFRKLSQWLDALAMDIAEVYEERTGRAASEWLALMRETKRFSAKEAVEWGLADSILEPSAKEKPAAAAASVQMPAVARLRAVTMANSLDKRLRIGKHD